MFQEDVKVEAPIVATRDVVACDGGQHGSVLCSNCSADVEKHFEKCPNCGAVLQGTNLVPYPFGGSDFR